MMAQACTTTGARYYSPALQRFLSEDPIEFVGRDVNLYAYVYSSPVNLIDPQGEAARIVIQLPSYCNPGSGRKDNFVMSLLRSFACDPSNMIPGPGVLTSSVGKMTNIFGKSAKEIRNAIEKVKQAGMLTRLSHLEGF